MRSWIAIPRTVVALSLALAACSSSRSAAPPAGRPPQSGSGAPAAARDPTLYATLWTQTSAEYRALAWQSWAAARESLERALADSSWTAAVEQEGRAFAALPPAVIVDVDETVLDNSAFQARVILDEAAFDPDAWRAWVEEARAPAVPGAAELLSYADSLDVTVFYVTNRDVAEEPGTRRNLGSAGLPLDPELDTVLVEGERAGWTGDKSSRRAAVAERFRILLLAGDDFNDFVSARLPRADRDRLVERYRHRWGERWIVLPNPTYGSWQRALIDGGADLDEAARARRLLEALEDFRP